MNDKLKTAILSVPFFSCADEKTLETVSSLKPVSFEKGKIIYSPETFFRGIGIVVEGKVFILGKSTEAPTLLNVLSVGSLFGVAALFGGNEEYVSTVKAKTKCEILFISEELMEEILKSDGKTAFAYIHFLTERIRFLNGKITGFSASTAEEAVSLYLLENGAEEGTPFSVNVSRLANSVGLERMSVYRVFHSLSEEQIIRFEKGVVTILSQKALLRKTGKK